MEVDARDAVERLAVEFLERQSGGLRDLGHDHALPQTKDRRPHDLPPPDDRAALALHSPQPTPSVQWPRQSPPPRVDWPRTSRSQEDRPRPRCPRRKRQPLLPRAFFT